MGTISTPPGDGLVKIVILDLKDLDVSMNLGKMPRFGMVSKDSLYIDPAYQRRMDNRRSVELVRKIVEDFAWSKFQPLTVVERPDGRFPVVDGQHRATAAILHPAIIDVPCWIIPAPAAQEQAKVFAGVNGDRTAVSSLNLFKAALAAADPDAMQVQKVCELAGVTIAFHTAGSSKKLKPCQTMAVSTIRKGIATHGEKPVLAALQTLVAAYPDLPGQIRAEMVSALTQVFRLYGDRIDRERLVRMLYDAPCEKLLVAARHVRDLEGGSTETCLVKALVTRYDRGAHHSRRLNQTATVSLDEVA